MVSPLLALAGPSAALAAYGCRNWRKKREALLRRERMQRNTQLWNTFIENTDSLLDPPDFSLKSSTEKCAVLVEPRKHPHLSFVLRMLFAHLDDTWALKIFHSAANKSYVEARVSGWGDVQMQEVCVEGLGHDEYQRLLLNPWFWEQVPCEHVLLFQCDSLLCRTGVDAYLGYDFVGAPYREKARGPWKVGRGSFSLRRRSVMRELTERWPSYRDTREDEHFSRVLIEHGYRLPSVETCKAFCVESNYTKQPLALHNPIPHLDPVQLDQLLRNTYDPLLAKKAHA